jgi:pSer/pThr/pTyr-binding forkhead associated (FHA) protein
MGTSSSRQSQSQSHSTTIAHSPPTGHGHSHGHGHGHGSTRTCSVPNESGESQSTIGVQEENEYPHLGSVQVSLSWLNPNALRSNDTDNSYIVTAKGGIFYGNSSPSPIVMSELDAVSMAPGEYPLMDSRAHQLLIAYDNGWNAISSPEVFSRHTGTCLIIGDRTNQGRGHEIKLGDCFRLGSVGVVVSELKHPGKKEERLDTQRLQYLREEALNFEHDGDEAVLAAKEENGVMNHSNVDGGVVNDDDEEMVSPTARDNISGNLFCYMCYESHDTPEDHLVAPCACKGDTRYLHVQCLQKWYQSSLAGWRSLVIRTTGSGAPACKICGMAYKTTMTNLDGVKTNLLEADHPGPYMSLVVVTRHDTSPELFNTKFRLNFGPGYRIGSTTELNTEDPEMNPSELTIGRSSMCNMVLDYRTVSTVHAKLFYRDGAFQLQDARSSNGTMLYLQGPLKLPLNQSLRLRMGRSTLAIEARRSLTASLRTVFTKQKLPPCKASLDELQRIMALAPSMLSKAGRTQEKDQMRTNLMRNFRDETQSNLNDADAEVEARGRGGRSNSPRGRNNVPSETTNEPAVSHHRLVSTTNASGSPRLFVTEEMLRDIFRHHQCQLPQGTCAQVPGNDQSSSIPRGGGGAPIATIAMRDGINIDSPLILGDRPSSRQGSAGISPANSSTPPPSGLIVDGGENNMADHDSQTQSQMNTAAVAIPPTALVYNHGLTTATSSGGPQRSNPPQDISSVNNLASITNATLASRDADGNPIVNQTEFLLQLDHQLQTIETCVQEAMEGALATVGDYASPDDKEREHAEMRVQRAIISQSIQKDTRTGRSVVDNESILLAATVICTKVLY